jgi:hypothetical protein
MGAQSWMRKFELDREAELRAVISAPPPRRKVRRLPFMRGKIRAEGVSHGVFLPNPGGVRCLKISM